LLVAVCRAVEKSGELQLSRYAAEQHGNSHDQHINNSPIWYTRRLKDQHMTHIDAFEQNRLYRVTGFFNRFQDNKLSGIIGHSEKFSLERSFF